MSQINTYADGDHENIGPDEFPPVESPAPSNVSESSGPEHGSPEWHLAQAEEHLSRADKIVKLNGDPTGRLLAATANAQIAALKLALQQDRLIAEAAADLRWLRERHQFDDYNRR